MTILKQLRRSGNPRIGGSRIIIKVSMSYNRVFAVLLLLICWQIAAPAQSHKSHATPKAVARVKAAERKPDLAEKINAILSQPQFAKAHWGIDAVDLATGKAIYALNQDQLFVPASNMKLIT